MAHTDKSKPNIISFIIVLGIVLFAVNTCNKPKNAEESQIEQKKKVKDYAHAIAMQFVKLQLKSPSTADFPYNSDATETVPDTFEVNSYVDSQNSFGAMIRTYFSCTVRYKYGDPAKGDSWELINLNTK